MMPEEPPFASVYYEGLEVVPFGDSPEVSAHADHQPGLGVSKKSQSGLEVVQDGKIKEDCEKHGVPGSGPIEPDIESKLAWKYPGSELKKRKFWGRRSRRFLILAGVVFVVIAAAVIGGAVGATVGKNHKSSSKRVQSTPTSSITSSSSSPTPTTSSSSNLTSNLTSTTSPTTSPTTSSTTSSTPTPTPTNLELDCPALNNQEYEGVATVKLVSFTFQQFCNTKANSTSDNIELITSPALWYPDVDFESLLNASSFTDCMSNCVGYNYYAPWQWVADPSADTCCAVSFQANRTSYPGNNCFLYSMPGTNVTSDVLIDHYEEHTETAFAVMVAYNETDFVTAGRLADIDHDGY